MIWLVLAIDFIGKLESFAVMFMAFGGGASLILTIMCHIDYVPPEFNKWRQFAYWVAAIGAAGVLLIPSQKALVTGIVLQRVSESKAVQKLPDVVERLLDKYVQTLEEKK